MTDDNKLWFDYDNVKKGTQTEYFGQFWYLLGNVNKLSPHAFNNLICGYDGI
jgi:hypothetical protein